MEADLAGLQNALGYRFYQQRILADCLVDPGRRIEWLGDKLLFGVLTELLYRRHPNSPTKELSALRQSFLRNVSLKALASCLGTNFQFGANAIERLIAAAWFDGGHNAVRRMLTHTCDTFVRSEIQQSNSELNTRIRWLGTGLFEREAGKYLFAAKHPGADSNFLTLQKRWLDSRQIMGAAMSGEDLDYLLDLQPLIQSEHYATSYERRAHVWRCVTQGLGEIWLKHGDEMFALLMKSLFSTCEALGDWKELIAPERKRGAARTKRKKEKSKKEKRKSRS